MCVHRSHCKKLYDLTWDCFVFTTRAPTFPSTSNKYMENYIIILLVAGSRVSCMCACVFYTSAHVQQYVLCEQYGFLCSIFLFCPRCAWLASLFIEREFRSTTAGTILHLLCLICYLLQVMFPCLKWFSIFFQLSFSCHEHTGSSRKTRDILGYNRIVHQIIRAISIYAQYKCHRNEFIWYGVHWRGIELSVENVIDRGSNMFWS